MKKIALMLGLFFHLEPITLMAQQVVIDKGHLDAVNSNALFRNAADLNNTKLSEDITTMQRNVNTNVAAVTTVQTIIFKSLTEVNEALKNGLQVKSIAILLEDIFKYQTQIKKIAKHDPYLLLFAEESILSMKSRSIKLVTEVGDFVLKGGKENMMNYNSRDELLKKIVTELRVIRGFSYGIYRSMYWAKARGIFYSINPYQGWINKDRQMINEIQWKIKLLKK